MFITILCYSWQVQNHTAGGTTFDYDKDLPGLAAWSTKTTGSAALLNQPIVSLYCNEFYRRLKQRMCRSGWDHNQYFLQGKLEALDTEGEWYYDPTSRQLYFWPPGITAEGTKLTESGCGVSPPARGSVEFKARDYALEHTATVHNLQISDIQFEGTTLHVTDCNNCTRWMHVGFRSSLRHLCFALCACTVEILSYMSITTHDSTRYMLQLS